MRMWLALGVIISAMSAPNHSFAQGEPTRISGAAIQQLYGQWEGTCSRNGKIEPWNLRFNGAIRPTTKINGTSLHYETDADNRHYIFDGSFSSDFQSVRGTFTYRNQQASCQANLTPKTDMLCIVNPSDGPETIALVPDIGARGKFILEARRLEVRPGDSTGALLWSHQDFDPTNTSNSATRIAPATRYLCQ